MKKNFPFVTAVVAAAGQGTRMGGGKLFAPLCGMPVVLHTLIAMESAGHIRQVVVISRQEDMLAFWDMAKEYRLNKLSQVVPGGATRQESVFAGIGATDPVSEYFAIHDGARPLASPPMIDRVIEDAVMHGAAAPGAAVKDTIKLRDESGFIGQTPDRSRLFAIQTPQVFKADLYRHAMGVARQEGVDFTDDCQLFEHIGQKVFISQGEYSNLKITTPEDLVLAGALLEEKRYADRLWL